MVQEDFPGLSSGTKSNHPFCTLIEPVAF